MPYKLNEICRAYIEEKWERRKQKVLVNKKKMKPLKSGEDNHHSE